MLTAGSRLDKSSDALTFTEPHCSLRSPSLL